MFFSDQEKHWAVVSHLLIIGEAVKNLSDEFRRAHPEVSWSDIARMRDKLIHHYAQIDLVEVRNAATRNVPELLTFIEPFLPPIEGE